MATRAMYYHPSLFTGWLIDQIKAANNVYTVLTTSTVNVETQSVSDIIANEVASANGYARQQVDVSALTGSYDATNNIINFSTVNSQFSASGGDIVFRSALLMIGGNGTRGNTSGSIWGVSQYEANETIANGSPTPYTIIWYPQWAMGSYGVAGVNPVF